MLKTIVAAIVISFAAGSIPAIAKVNCEHLCAGVCQSSKAPGTCRDRCLPACEKNHNKK